MDKCKCYLCEKLCYCDSQVYDDCQYRKCKSFGMLENRMYEESCTRLAVRFAKKHGWRFEGWVGHFDPNKHTWYEGSGGHAVISDTVYSFEDIRTDLMMDASLDAIERFYEEMITEGMLAENENRPPRYVNYRSWLLGARCNPEDCSKEYLDKLNKDLEESSKRLKEARINLEKQLRECGHDNIY